MNLLRHSFIIISLTCLLSLPSGIIQIQLDYPYRFSGKERLDAIGQNLYDFGARQFTATLPRWLTMDPLAEKYFNLCPYLYCAGNPMVMLDMDGKGITSVLKTFKTIRKAYKASKTAKRVTVGTLLASEVYGYYDDLITLSGSESSWAEKGFAFIDVTTGFGGEAKAIVGIIGLNNLLNTGFRSFTSRNFRHKFGTTYGIYSRWDAGSLYASSEV